MMGLRGDCDRRPTTLVLLFALVLAGAVPGCDGYEEVKARLSPAEVARFERGQSAASPCWACHDITGTGTKIGPHLSGLIGRPIGSLSGYGYSDAFLQAGGTWNAQTLDRFLANVTGFIPGTRMISPSIGDPDRRGDLIFFLEQATAPR